MPKKSSSRKVVSLGPVVTQDIGGINQSANGALGVVSGTGAGTRKKKKGSSTYALGSGPISRSQYRISRAAR